METARAATRRAAVDAARLWQWLRPEAGPLASRSLPIATHLRRLIAVVLIPLLALGLYLALRLAEAERSVTEARRADLANNLSFLADRELASVMGELRALSTSADLVSGDMVAFRRQAEATGRLTHINAIVVTDAKGATLLSTLVPAGAPSLPGSVPWALDEVVKGRASVSGVVVGRVSDRPVVAVSLPVVRDGAVVYALTAGIQLERFRNLFAEAGMEPGWTAAIVDREGLFVARNVDADRRAGTPARPELVAAARSPVGSGRYENVVYEGTATATFFRRSSLSGWIAAVAVPTSVLNAPYWRSLGLLALLGTMATLGTLVAASAMGRRISDPVRILGTAAAALAQGRPLPAIPAGVAEIVEVAEGLHRAEMFQRHRHKLELQLAESEERQRLAIEAGGFGTWEADPETGSAIWSREYFGMFGYPVPAQAQAVANMAMWRERLHPDEAVAVEAEIERARRVGDRYHSEHRILRADTGELRWVRKDGQFRPAPDGRTRFVGVTRDITERKLGAARLAESEARFRLAAEAVAGIIYDYDVASGHATRSMGLERVTGWKPDEVPATASWWQKQIHPDDRIRLESTFPAILSARQRTVESTYRVRHRSGRWVHVLDRATVIYDRDGNHTRIVGATVDVTRDVERELVIRESEVRLRHAAESARLTHMVTDLAADRLWIGDNFASVMGVAVPAVREGVPFSETAERILARIHPEDQVVLERLRETFMASPETGGTAQFRLTGDDGVERWIESTWTVERVPVGTLQRIISTALDITDKKRHEEQLRLLMGEVNHRAKNLLSLVQAIARQTARSGDPATFVERLSERLMGLAASQDLLLKTQWTGIEIGELVRTQLAHFKDLFDTRIVIEGPLVRLNAMAAQSIGMALHELATNAGKYGALSKDHGCVEIVWSIDRSPMPMFAMTWRERDGPIVIPPSRQGFGQTVMVAMVRSALNGDASLDYKEDGVTWKLCAPYKNCLELWGGVTSREYE